MSFISLSFFLFFFILIIIYFFITNYVQNKILFQKGLLLAASLIFYSFSNLVFFPFLIYVIVISYCAGKFCNNKRSFSCFIILALVPLLFIKYGSFLGINNHFFPLGLSFFTFQSISYITDVYTKKITPEKNLANVSLFVSFFPTITSGPIQRADKLIPQFSKVKTFDYNKITLGLKLFTWGLFKKLCIADRIAVYVNYIYGNLENQYGVTVLFATILYSFQIYSDFSGYSDMVIGIANFLGFDIGINFDHPYLSKSISEFWRRWHISLSSWLRDYVYIPLGGSRVSIPLIYRNLIITFLISGIWHGSTLNFVIWGGMHGIYQCIGRIIKTYCKNIKIPSFIKVAVTFLLVTFAWIFFRSESINQSRIIILKILDFPKDIIMFNHLRHTVGIIEAFREIFLFVDFGFYRFLLLVLFVVILVISDIITFNKSGKNIITRFPVFIRLSLYVIVIVSIYFFSSGTVSSNFIYNNF